MVWVVGAGNMARAYIKVLKALGVEFLVIGRGNDSARIVADQELVEVIPGGIAQYLATKPLCSKQAIVCTPVDTLTEVTLELINYGVPSILVEKPAALIESHLQKLESTASKNAVEVVIGYNRRFYQSVLKLEELIAADGGLTACNFEITEWGHRVAEAPSSAEVKSRWLLANSSHVIDLAFYISGFPSELTTYTSGSLDWHPSASRFTGAGVSTTGALISYMGYWDGPGRWSLEFVTRKNRYVLRPMERLSVQALGSVTISDVIDIDYRLDEDFKPGLFLQTKCFLESEFERFCSLSEQRKSFDIYRRIASYDD